MKIDHGKFISLYKAQYGALDDSQSSGMDKLLGFLEVDSNVSDVRWAAYMLATVKEECADTWQPIEQGARGKGQGARGKGQGARVPLWEPGAGHG